MAYSLHFYDRTDSYLSQILKSLLQRKSDSCLPKTHASIRFQ